MAHTQILYCSNGFNTDFAPCMHCTFYSILEYHIVLRAVTMQTHTPTQKTHMLALLKAKQWIFQTTVWHVFSIHIRGDLLHCTAYVESDKFHTMKLKLKRIKFDGIDFHLIQFIHMENNSSILHSSRPPNMEEKYWDIHQLGISQKCFKIQKLCQCMISCVRAIRRLHVYKINFERNLR